MKKYKCTICKYEYDPAQGDPTQGIAPGTPFEQLPADWKCPRCKHKILSKQDGCKKTADARHRLRHYRKIP